MNYRPNIELGQLVQTAGSLIAATGVCVFAYAFLVADVGNSKVAIADNKQAIVTESMVRLREDSRLKKELESRATEIKQEIKAVETRQRFLLENMSDDIKYLVRERRADEK